MLLTHTKRSRKRSQAPLDSKRSAAPHNAWAVNRNAYDDQGHRFEKKVTTNGTVTLRQRYLYRGYLQIACLDLTRANQPALWYITWDPTQSPRGFGGRLDTSQEEPGGRAANGVAVSQPIQWSSEYHDVALGFVYYNSKDGRWPRREQKQATHKHNKMCPHYHVFTVMQSPPITGCGCFAPKQETHPTSQGYMSYVHPTGGDIEVIK